MSSPSGGLVGLVAQARRAAQRRSQRASTAHLVLVLLQSGEEVARLLERFGLREARLLVGLASVEDEAQTTLELALEDAERTARAVGVGRATPLHLLLALLVRPRTGALRCLVQAGVDLEGLRLAVEERLGVPAAIERAGGPRLGRERPLPPPQAPVRPVLPPRRPPPAPPARGPAAEGARVGSEPVRAGGAEAGGGAAPVVGLRAAPAELPGVPGRERRRPGDRRAAGPGKRGARRPAAPPLGAVLAEAAGRFALDPTEYPILASLGRNLSEAAAEGRIDPVLGRDAEIDRLLDVLARRRANNPILVGPPGVGKTAIVEGLALRIARAGEGLAGFEGRIVLETSAGALVSGTGVRGALAERVRLLKAEIAKSRGRVLLFLDEIHSVVGGHDGPDDLAHELKAALARGELSCIGATTEAEYRRHFERDAALARRFCAVFVVEPTAAAAREIVHGVAPQYERHHEVSYAPDAIGAAVDLSVRYLTDRQLPDKAISVLDLAGARARRRGATTVDRAQVAHVVAELGRVPVERLLMTDAERLLALEAHLGARIVGHADAMRSISAMLRKSAAGLQGRRPLGTLLLLGPTGVGKTETAKALAELLFPGGGMTSFDMSDFSEAHAVARLVGAPPGYVGHDDGGQLTEAVRRRPYQLVLLDEIEKAHRDVLLALMPVLDEGRLVDSRGRAVDFTSTVICMTSNLGSDLRARSGRVGFGDASSAAEDLREAVLAAARRGLAPELWNRIDEPLFFGPLARSEVAEVARRLLGALGAALRRDRAVTLDVDDAAIEALLTAGGFDPELGARPMRRTVARLVEAPIAALLLAGRVVPGSVLEVRAAGQGVAVRLAAGADAAE